MERWKIVIHDNKACMNRLLPRSALTSPCPPLLHPPTHLPSSPQSPAPHLPHVGRSAHDVELFKCVTIVPDVSRDLEVGRTGMAAGQSFQVAAENGEGGWRLLEAVGGGWMWLPSRYRYTASRQPTTAGSLQGGISSIWGTGR